jgi:hypothetical protein
MPLSCKQGAIAIHGVAEHAFICIHLVCAKMMAREKLNLLPDLAVVVVHHGGPIAIVYQG